MQVLLDSVHKGSLDGQLGGGPPLGLQEGPDDAGYLVQVLRPHQVGFLPTVQIVVDVLIHSNVHKYGHISAAKNSMMDRSGN